jgi:hypothetical protein
MGTKNRCVAVMSDLMTTGVCAVAPDLVIVGCSFFDGKLVVGWRGKGGDRVSVCCQGENSTRMIGPPQLTPHRSVVPRLFRSCPM